MFTGIVQKGKIHAISASETGWELAICMPNFAAIVQLGDSVAIDGACLTVTKVMDDNMYFFVSTESIAKTIIRNYKVGDAVNTELPMQPNGYLGGHYVLGHVDATAKVNKIDITPTAWFLTIQVPEQFVKYIVYKGSIAINGVSLTINEVSDQLIDLCIIPTTLDKTNINQLAVDSIVNIEFDILAKYTEQLLLKRNV
jgi:riboflavin synthase